MTNVMAMRKFGEGIRWSRSRVHHWQFEFLCFSGSAVTKSEQNRRSGLTGFDRRFAAAQRLYTRFPKEDAGEMLFGNRNKTAAVKFFGANLCNKSLLPVMIAGNFL